MRTWHPACGGYVMRQDDHAEDLYAEYQIGDLFRYTTHTRDSTQHAGQPPSEARSGRGRGASHRTLVTHLERHRRQP